MDEVLRVSDKVKTYLQLFKELPISKLRDHWTVHIYKGDTEVISSYLFALACEAIYYKETFFMLDNKLLIYTGIYSCARIIYSIVLYPQKKSTMCS